MSSLPPLILCSYLPGTQQNEAAKEERRIKERDNTENERAQHRDWKSTSAENTHRPRDNQERWSGRATVGQETLRQKLFPETKEGILK